MSYTTFEYKNLVLSPEKIRTDKSITVHVEVKNTGNLAGDEVVQLYVTDVESSVPTPIRSLKGFQRVHLKPGEQKTLTFQLTPAGLSFYDEEMGWIVEPGEFEIMVGGSSKSGIKGRFEVN